MENVLQIVKGDSGALYVGAAWGIYVIAQHILTNLRNSKRQDSVDTASNTLVASLQKAMDESVRISAEERDRADRHAKTVNDMMVELGALRADLRYAERERDEVKAEVLRNRVSIEGMVQELRNRDRSLQAVTDVNRKVLRMIGSTAEAVEPLPTPPENEQ